MLLQCRDPEHQRVCPAVWTQRSATRRLTPSISLGKLFRSCVPRICRDCCPSCRRNASTRTSIQHMLSRHFHCLPVNKVFRLTTSPATTQFTSTALVRASAIISDCTDLNPPGRDGWDIMSLSFSLFALLELGQLSFGGYSGNHARPLIIELGDVDHNAIGVLDLEGLCR